MAGVGGQGLLVVPVLLWSFFGRGKGGGSIDWCGLYVRGCAKEENRERTARNYQNRKKGGGVRSINTRVWMIKNTERINALDGLVVEALPVPLHALCHLPVRVAPVFVDWVYA